MDFFAGGFALLILHYLDHWFHRTKRAGSRLMPAEKEPPHSIPKADFW
jgi:hypothetical protein